MVTVTGLTKDRMLQIEGNSVVSGYVTPDNHLKLVQKDGDEIDAGPITAFMPDRIGTQGQQISDWNSAINAGFYWGTSAANSPSLDNGGTYSVGWVLYHGVNPDITQLVMNSTTSSGTLDLWKRTRHGVTWTGWIRVDDNPAWVDRGYASHDQVRIDPGNLVQSAYLHTGVDGIGISNATAYTGPEVSPIGAPMVLIASRDHLGTYLSTCRPDEEFYAEIVAKQISGSATIDIGAAFLQGDGTNPVNSNWYDFAVIEPFKIIEDLGNGWYRYSKKFANVGDRNLGMMKAWIQINQNTPYTTSYVISKFMIRRLDRGMLTGWYSLPTVGTWDTYLSYQNDGNYLSDVGATKLNSGLVVLTGLLRNTGTPANGEQILGVLPKNLWPEYSVIHAVDSGNSTKAITISSSGIVSTRAGWASAQYLSLDGVAYWAKHSDAKWNDVGTAGSSFSTFVDASNSAWNSEFGYPGWFTDIYGCTWFRGLLYIKSTISADNTRLINLPDAARSIKQQHMQGCGNDAYAGFGCQGSALGTQDGLNWKPNSPSSVSSWLSLYGIRLNTAASETLIPWYTPRLYFNSWAAYTGNFYPLRFAVRGDGLRVTQGMMMSPASVGSIIAPGPIQLGIVHKTFGRMILANISNNQHARVDLYGLFNASSSSAFAGVTGAASNWWAFDNIHWKTKEY